MLTAWFLMGVSTHIHRAVGTMQESIPASPAPHIAVFPHRVYVALRFNDKRPLGAGISGVISSVYL
jgi:hypothetical protein